LALDISSNVVHDHQPFDKLRAIVQQQNTLKIIRYLDLSFTKHLVHVKKLWTEKCK